MVDITAWLESKLSCDRDPRSPPGPRFDRSSLVTDLVRLSGFERFEKKFVKREVDGVSWFF